MDASALLPGLAKLLDERLPSPLGYWIGTAVVISAALLIVLAPITVILYLLKIDLTGLVWQRVLLYVGSLLLLALFCAFFNRWLNRWVIHRSNEILQKVDFELEGLRVSNSQFRESLEKDYKAVDDHYRASLRKLAVARQIEAEVKQQFVSFEGTLEELAQRGGHDLDVIKAEVEHRLSRRQRQHNDDDPSEHE
ncbi:MAG: hypothetical protein OXG65_14230 [Chloroflexi bacterium]|nr:hypothetical protein [Chloroflexota bacterium]